MIDPVGLMKNHILDRIPKIGNGRSAIMASSILALFCCASCWDGTKSRKVDAAAPNKPVPIRIAKVELRQIRRDVESVGSLFPFEEVTVSSEVEGKVEQVLVDVGDRVVAGQPLVKVSPTELKLAVEQQRAVLEQARARLGLPEGGDDLHDIRDAAEVKKAAADLNDADQKFHRGKSLLQKGLIPRENFDELEAKYKSARAAYDLAVQTVQNLRAELSLYRASAALADKKLNDSTIRAPFAGQIKERSVTQGQYLKVQTPVMVIVNTDPVRVRLKVPEKMAGWIRVGQSVTLSIEAYPSNRFTGKLWRINPSVDPQTRSFEVEALIANHQGLLKPGFFVKANIPSEKVEGALLVPPQALQYVYGIYKVYVVEGKAIKEKEVRIGDHPSDGVEIMDGLQQGEGIALPLKGTDLRDGAAIEIVE